MQYRSLSPCNAEVSFSEAVIQGQTSDGGLFFPKSIPHDLRYQDPKQHFESPADLATSLLAPMLSPEVNSSTLRKICDDAFNFEFPLIQLDQTLWVLELFHGPSAAFKDVGARFLSRLLSQLGRDKITILVATSGDTGGAVAAGFYDIPNVEVVILYPKGRVSPLQERQLTCWGSNISALEVEGSFDDCQSMVKAMLSDQELRQKLSLTSANSINLARWLPQASYYAWASYQLKKAPFFVVPSGNFGNLAAGIFAWRRGVAAQGFLAATNRNDVFPQYLESGQYEPRASVRTPSNAMDVGKPSNHPRVEALFDHDLESMRKMIQAESISDNDTLTGIKAMFDRYQYTICPHGAVAYSAYQAHQSKLSTNNNSPTVLLATAHPAKFNEVVEPVLNVPTKLPKTLVDFAQEKPSFKESLSAQADALKSYLLSR